MAKKIIKRVSKKRASKVRSNMIKLPKRDSRTFRRVARTFPADMAPFAGSVVGGIPGAAVGLGLAVRSNKKLSAEANLQDGWLYRNSKNYHNRMSARKSIKKAIGDLRYLRDTSPISMAQRGLKKVIRAVKRAGKKHKQTYWVKK